MPDSTLSIRTLAGVAEWSAFLRALVVACSVRALMHLRPARAESVLGWGVKRHGPIHFERYIAVIDLALCWAGRLVRIDCLVRGVTRYRMFRREGIAVDLVFGAGTVNDKFAAHCWLELDGVPYLEAANTITRFKELYRWPLPSATPAGAALN